MFALLSMVLPVIAFVAAMRICGRLATRKVDRARTDHCAACGYDLRDNESGTCPECGAPIDPDRLADADRAILAGGGAFLLAIALHLALPFVMFVVFGLSVGVLGASGAAWLLCAVIALVLLVCAVAIGRAGAEHRRASALEVTSLIFSLGVIDVGLGLFVGVGAMLL